MKKNYTTFEIARMLHVYPTTVANWVDEKKILAFTTPGGHRRVAPIDLLHFLEKHKMPIPNELAEETAKSGPVILIVDDDIKLLNSFETLLKKEKGRVIITVKDGFAAGQAISEHKPDLVLLDIMLPGMDGFKVCSLIKEKNKATAIIAISGFASNSDVKRIISLGANAFFSKPIDMEKLLAKIDSLLTTPRRPSRGKTTVRGKT